MATYGDLATLLSGTPCHILLFTSVWNTHTRKLQNTHTRKL